MKWVAAMFDIYTEILVIYLSFISSDPILQYIISMYNVKFTKFHETVGYVRGGSLDDFGLPGGSPKSGFDIPIHCRGSEGFSSPTRFATSYRSKGNFRSAGKYSVHLIRLLGHFVCHFDRP
jgi:hypothetical protein